jgi:hypothetical protein
VVNPLWAILGGLTPVLDKIDPSFFVGLAFLNNAYPNGGPANLVPRTILALEEGDLDYVRTAFGAPDAPPAAAAAPAPVVARADEPVIQVDQPLFQGPFSTLLAFAQAMAADAESGIDIHWLAIVLNDLQARLVAGEDQVDLMEDLITLSVVPNAGVGAEYLIDYADEHLSAAAAEAANAVVAQMSHNDVRKTMWTIQDVAMRLGQPEVRTSSAVQQNAVNCAEDIAFTTPEEAQAYLDASPYPQLLTLPVEVNNLIFQSCEFFPKPLDKSVSEPVMSDIPTLVFQQALDIQTPVSWAQDILQNLNTGYYVEWPNIGHIAIGHDMLGCAGDIAAAFLDNPERAPDSRCAQTEDYTLKFVLPE